MWMSKTVRKCLNEYDVKYHMISHQHSANTETTARNAHVPLDSFAKAVLMDDGERFILAVVPGSRKVDVNAIESLHGSPVFMTEEEMLSYIFRDCDKGALPPLGTAWGIETIVDPSLFDSDDIFFEAGDHEHVLQVTRDAFMKLMESSIKASISHVSEA